MLLQEVHGRPSKPNAGWKLSPLADVPIDMDRFTNGPHFKLKVHGVVIEECVCARVCERERVAACAGVLGRRADWDDGQDLCERSAAPKL